MYFCIIVSVHSLVLLISGMGVEPEVGLMPFCLKVAVCHWAFIFPYHYIVIPVWLCGHLNLGGIFSSLDRLPLDPCDATTQAIASILPLVPFNTTPNSVMDLMPAKPKKEVSQANVEVVNARLVLAALTELKPDRSAKWTPQNMQS